MKRPRERIGFAIHVTFALLCTILLALDMVKAEAALTGGKMMTMRMSVGGSG